MPEQYSRWYIVSRKDERAAGIHATSIQTLNNARAEKGCRRRLPFERAWTLTAESQ